ncbi:MAG: LysM peptidoglycan-binding domain-containing protein [Brachymonas sp.]|nr:LysM peptidoglycan-binding domain-containing protein [Brachymonas sp.]
MLTNLAKGLALGSLLMLGLSGTAWAQKYPVTLRQRQVARATAARGVPISALAPNAPSEYIVKKGDTLWDISKKFLRDPWRWPELWGMNLQQIRDPHLIYPGQRLWLEISGGRARLRLGKRISGGTGSGGTVVLQPRVREESLADKPIATVPPHMIEPFLSEPIIVDEATLKNAHWVVSSKDGRTMLGTGDRIYARSEAGTALQYADNEDGNIYRIFRNAVPIKDPITKEVLGYEGKFVGRARLVRSETVSTKLDGGDEGIPEAAKLDIIYAKEDIRIGDRLLPEPAREVLNHTPHAPLVQVDGLVASVYGDAVTYVGQNQIITINKGTRDGVSYGDVLTLISTGQRIVDKANNRRGDTVKLPDEFNGLLYIFRPFERLSYGLVVEIKEPVKVGDRVENPSLNTVDDELPAGATAMQPITVTP